MSQQAVLVLNADHSIINIVNWKRALTLVLKGRAEIIEESNRVVSNFEKTVVFTVPAVIKLVSFVKNVYKARVAFNKTNVFIRDKYKCQYCSSTEHLTVDHVIPLSKGGKTTWENCVTACKHCNMLKGSKLLKDTNLTLKSKLYHPGYVQYLQAKIEIFGLDSIFKDIS